MKRVQRGRNLVSWILVFCMIVSLAAMLPDGNVTAAEETPVSDSVFVHPGLMHTAESIEAIKKNVANNVEPTISAYHALAGDGFSNPGWGGRPLEHVVRGGSGDNRAQMFIDIERAYQTALLYQLGAGEQYGEAAVRILNGWSHTMKSLSGNADRFLASGIYGYQMANAAELVRDREDFDKEAMDTLLLNVFYPMNHDFLVNHNGTSEGRRIRNYWANWDLCNIAGMLAIGIFCDRTDIYEEAVEYYRNGVGQGSFYNAMPYVYDVGLAQWQEAGRDQGHTTLGISLCGAINEMAWSQGENLYGLSDNRFLKAAEYVAKYNNWDDDVPYSYYERYNSANGKWEGNPGISGASRGSRRPVFTAVYNHYVNRMGLEAPELEKVLYPDGTAPFTEGGTRGGDEPGWQSLTFHNISTTEEGKNAEEMNGNLEDGIYRFWNRNSKKCLVDRNGLLQSAAKGTMEEEWWEVRNTGDGEYIVTNTVTGRVIQTEADTYTSDAAAYKPGTRYVLGNNVTGEMCQRLAFLKVTGDYIYRIVSGSCSLVLEYFNARTEDDAALGQWWYEGGWNQQWYVEQKEPSKRKIAGFHLDDKASGLTGAGAAASSSDTLSFVKDEERGMVLSLSGSECLTVTKEDKSALLGGCTELTISYYSKSGGTGEGIPFYAAASADAGSYIRIVERGTGVFADRKENGSGNSAEGSLSGGWNHVVAVYQAGHVKLYVNGVLQSDAKNQGSLETILGTGGVVQIGENFHGYLDDFTIYNYAMRESSIKAMEGRKLVAEFTFDDEIDGFVSGDARANSAGRPVLSEDAKAGKALSFDGSGRNYLCLANDQGEPLAGGWEEMTISYWSKADGNGTNWIFYAAPDDEPQVLGSEVYLGAFENGGVLTVERYKNTGTRISNIAEAAAKDVWKHITVSFGRNMTAVYVNGERKAALQNHYSIADILGEESVFYIGKANWSKQGEYCNALLDQVRIYNFALDDTEAKKDYEGYPAAQNPGADDADHLAEKAAARAVMDKISAIGTVTFTETCFAKITDARSAYEALTAEQKPWVMNYQALVLAEEQYEDLKPIEKRRIAYFSFDNEESGFTYAEETGYAKAESQSAVKLSDNAVSGKALKLDGAESGNYLKLIDSEGKSIVNGCKELTVSYWSKLYSAGANWGFYAAPNDKTVIWNREKYLGVYDGGNRVELNRYYNLGSHPQNPAAEAELGEWRYLTAVYREHVTELYIDGMKVSEVSSEDTVSEILGRNGTAYIGKANWGNGEYYNGLLDEVSIYNYGLSQEEITELYEQNAAPNYPVEKKCIAKFSFDDEETGFAGAGAKAQSVGANVLTDQAVSGNALRLDGSKSSNYLKVTDAKGNPLLDCCDELTVSYWSKVNNTSANWAFYASANDNGQGVGTERYLGVIDEGVKLTAQRYKNTGERPESASAETAKRAWKHITVVYSKTGTCIYVNGELAGSETASGYALPEITGDHGIVYIGKANWGSGEYFNGWLDEMSIYNYAMSQEEVTALYGEHTHPVETHRCIAEFTFDSEETGFAGEGAKANASGANVLSNDAVSGRALSLEGGKNYLTLTDTEGNALFKDCKRLTVSYWSKISNTNANWAFYASKNADTQKNGTECYLGILENGTITAERYNNSGIRPSNANAQNVLNEWKFVTVVFSLTDTSIYINGVSTNKETDSEYKIEDIVGKDGVVYIGRANWGNGEYYNGLIDEVSIFDYPLGEDEILELYHSYPEPGADFAAAESAEKLIEAIGTVTLDVDCKEKINAAREAYNALTESQKSLITEGIYTVLTDAEAEYTRLAEQAAQDELDREAVESAEAVIKAIGTVAYDASSKERIDLAWEAYETLSKKQQSMLNQETYAILLAAEAEYQRLAGESDEGKKDLEAARAVEVKIQAIGTVEYTAECKEKMDQAREAYDSLTDAQKGLVTTEIYKMLTAAEAEYERLKEEKEERDQQAAKEAEEAIKAIGTVVCTAECKEKIALARKAYNALTEDQKRLVSAELYKKLTAAETEYTKLEQASGQQTADRGAAEAAVIAIKAIGTVTYSTGSKAKIDLARRTYDKLTTAQKALINAETYKKLTDAEKTYADLLAAYEKAEQEKAEKEKAEQEQAAKEKAQWGTVPAEESQKAITKANTDKGDPKGSAFAALKAKAAGGNKSVTLSWSKVKGADGYLVYGAPCGKQMQLLKELSSSQKSYKQTKLKKGVYYKYIVSAYKNIYGEKRIVATSVSVHACTNGGKYANPTSILYKQTKVTVKKGKTFTLKPKLKSKKTVKTHIAKFRYESSDPNVATVSKQGKIKGKAKGSCYVYLYTQNGIYKRVRVVIK